MHKGSLVCALIFAAALIPHMASAQQVKDPVVGLLITRATAGTNTLSAVLFQVPTGKVFVITELCYDSTQFGIVMQTGDGLVQVYSGVSTGQCIPFSPGLVADEGQFVTFGSSGTFHSTVTGVLTTKSK